VQNNFLRLSRSERLILSFSKSKSNRCHFVVAALRYFSFTVEANVLYTQLNFTGLTLLIGSCDFSLYFSDITDCISVDKIAVIKQKHDIVLL